MFKFASLIVIFGCAAAVFAATTVLPADQDIAALIKRAQTLVNQGRKSYDAHKEAGRSHLLEAFLREVHLTEIYAIHLETLSKFMPNSMNVQRIKETLEWHENRVAEELSFVEAVYKNYQPSNKSADELAQFGEKLIADGKAVLAKHSASAKADDLKVIEHEVKAVEFSLAHVKGVNKPSYHVEEVLLRHELTLRAAIVRVQAPK